MKGRTLFFRILGIAILSATFSFQAAAGNPTLSEVAWVYVNAKLSNGDRAFGDIATIGVELPKHGIRVIPPADGVPDACAAFSGPWAGTHGNGRPLLLIVEEVTTDCKATISFGWGSEPGKEINIAPPWREVISKRLGVPALVRRGDRRNLPVTYSMSDIDIRKGVMKARITKNTVGRFKIVGDGEMRIEWGPRGTLHRVTAADLQLQPQTEPPVGFSLAVN